jgi:Na+/H+ antiporter
VHYAVIFVLLLGFVLGLGLLARRLAIPYPILFVIGGLLIGFIPDLPQLTLNPDFIFFIFLPPLLYIQAFNTSWRDFRRELRPILLLAIGLVIVTTVVIAYLAHWIIPGFGPESGPFPLAAGFVLGAIISTPDAIAAAAIAQRLGLPRRVITVLEGESLVNDATSLVIFQLALVAILNPDAHFFGGVWRFGYFTYVVIGGISVGLAVGWLVSWLRRQVIDDGPEIVLTVSLLTPFVSYLAGDVAHVSGVLAVVTTGLYLGRTLPRTVDPAARLKTQAVWEAIVYFLNGMVFVLIGLQLPGILHHMREHWWPRPYLYAVAITLACILIRLAWVFPGAYLPRLLNRRIRETEPVPDWREVFVIGWAGMRGVVSLAAALALNGYPQFPRGHLTQFIAFSVILGTLVFQGLSLPAIIHHLGLSDDGSAGREEGDARQRMVATILEKIEEARRDEKYPEEVLAEVEHFYREHALAEHDHEEGHHERHHHFNSLRQLQHTMIHTGRHTLITLRHDGLISDDVLRKIEHELDLEEARLRIGTTL